MTIAEQPSWLLTFYVSLVSFLLAFCAVCLLRLVNLFNELISVLKALLRKSF